MDSDGFLHDSSGSLRPLNYDGRVVSTMLLVLALIILVIRLILKSSFL